MIYFPFELSKIYERERIEEAEHCRLLQQIRAGEPGYLSSGLTYLPRCLWWQLKKQFKQTLAALTKVEVRLEGWLRNRLSH